MNLISALPTDSHPPLLYRLLGALAAVGLVEEGEGPASSRRRSGLICGATYPVRCGPMPYS